MRSCWLVAAAASLSLVAAGCGSAAETAPRPTSEIARAVLATKAPSATGSDLIAVNTNCGTTGVTYIPAHGGPMTRADYKAVGEPLPPRGSPERQKGTKFVVPRCSALPKGVQPGGPEITVRTAPPPRPPASAPRKRN